MSLPRAMNKASSLRAMHTGTRQIPHLPTPSTSPHNAHQLQPHHPTPTMPPTSLTSQSIPQKYSIPPARHLPHPLATHTPKGKLIPTRDPAITTAPKSTEQKTSTEHPLWKFFRVQEGYTRWPLGGMGLTVQELKNLPETIEESGRGLGSLEPIFENDQNLRSGRSWTADELRSKSFQDLHTLWYLLLRERNVLATQREERRRLGLAMDGDLLTKRGFRCRKSMARIKYVLNERRLALIAAAESTRPDTIKIHGQSPLGAADPMSITGWEAGSEVARSAYPLDSALGDGERQKKDWLEEKDEVVEGETVAKEEIEGRDEGFGSGKEAEDFVKNTKI